MSSKKPSDYILKLRLELKEWERAFAVNHDGRKPSREEVKKDVKIAAKYKEYRKLRASVDTAPAIARAEVDPDSISMSRPNSPKKSATVTPRKSTHNLPWGNGVYESPVSAHQHRLFSNQTRDSVGPTPQKNGNVLGLFESFMDAERTPVKCSTSVTNHAATTTVECVPASPVAQDVLTTPRKRKIGEVDDGTPSKNDLGILSTPTFLRRDKAHFIDIENSPPIPRPLGPPKRGLSSILAELRDMENHAFDDEEEAMRDMESDAKGGDDRTSKVPPIRATAQSGLELPPPPPGAFSEERVKEVEASPVNENRVWKKKGLKRQTRRVIMRPVKVKKTELELHNEQEDESIAGDELFSGNDSGSEHVGSDENDNKRGVSHSKRSEVTANRDTSSVNKAHATTLAEKGKSIVKNAVRKVGATAHANYRRLNIRNKNSKAKGRGGKFYRRR